MLLTCKSEFHTDVKKRKKKKVYHHDEEQLTFYQNVIQNSQAEKGRIFFNLGIAINSNLLDKTILKTKSNATFNMKEVDLDES